MGNIGTDKNTQRKEGKLVSMKMAAAKILKGAMVGTVAGFLTNGGNTATLVFQGIAYEAADNSAGGAGDLSIRIEKDGTHVVVCAGVAQADVGQEVFLVDNQTVQTARTSQGIKCGKIVQYIAANTCRIDISGYAVQTIGMGAAVASAASPDGVAAAGAAPTKAEYDAVVLVANEAKAQLNALLLSLRAAGLLST